jgi:site-specific recombinase XerD
MKDTAAVFGKILLRALSGKAAHPSSSLRADCESYKTVRLAEVSRTTVGMEISIVRGFFAFVVRLGGAAFNPMLGVKVPNPDRRKKSLAFSDPVEAPKSAATCTNSHEI